MRSSEKTAEVMAALHRVQTKMGHVRKDAEGNYGTYSTITGILDTVRPVLEEEGVLLMQPPGGINAQGDVELETVFHHVESGEWVAFQTATPVGKKTAQGVGSALTYLRRYSLLGTLALGTIDDDGEGAEAEKKKARKAKDYDAKLFEAEEQLEALLEEYAGTDWLTFSVRQRAARRMDEKDLDGMLGAIAWISEKAAKEAAAVADARAAQREERK